MKSKGYRWHVIKQIIRKQNSLRVAWGISIAIEVTRGASRDFISRGTIGSMYHEEYSKYAWRKVEVSFRREEAEEYRNARDGTVAAEKEKWRTRCAIWTKVDRRRGAPGNQDLHFSAEIGFAIKGFEIKFNSAGAPTGPRIARYFDLVVVWDLASSLEWGQYFYVISSFLVFTPLPSLCCHLALSSFFFIAKRFISERDNECMSMQISAWCNINTLLFRKLEKYFKYLLFDLSFWYKNFQWIEDWSMDADQWDKTRLYRHKVYAQLVAVATTVSFVRREKQILSPVSENARINFLYRMARE